MQVALPRTIDASNMQEQIGKQPEQYQTSLTHEQLNLEKVKRQQTQTIDRTATHHEDDQENQSDEQEKDDQTKQSFKQKKLQHPFLGNKIDYIR